jgi:hypothetical protein
VSLQKQGVATDLGAPRGLRPARDEFWCENPGSRLYRHIDLSSRMCVPGPFGHFQPVADMNERLRLLKVKSPM